MPGKVKVKIIAGKNLPVMDRSRETTDAYVEIKFGSTTFKTDVCKKTLNPQWNTDWFRFEVDDLELQDEPLQIRLMDYDTYSANDSIGKVYLNLNPLLLPSGSILPRVGLTADSNTGEQVTSSIMSGWLPVYDTLHGIRGEVNVIVKVELFSDFNRFRQSSCGIQFFCSSVIPHGYYCQMINGFVEELIVNNDPEYQWIDKIRTPRSSNETRQTFFFKLSCELQRKIGLKAIELGGNAVIGYSQCFDLEREANVVMRGIGTAVTLIKLRHPLAVIPLDINTEENVGSPTSETVRPSHCHQRAESVGAKATQSPARYHPIPFMHRRSSDSDLSITPKGNSLTGSDKSFGLPTGYFSRVGPLLKSIGPQENFEMLEYPFLTISKVPPTLIVYLGGVVSARAVKLLGRMTNHDEPESRDTWWTEIRMEIRSHARALGCNAVLGYSESSTLCEDVCVISASGTAAVIDISYTGEISDGISGIPFISKPYYSNKEIDKCESERDKTVPKSDSPFPCTNITTKPLPESPDHEPNSSQESPCSMCHISYVGGAMPLGAITARCQICRSNKVPEVLLTTIEMPEGMPSVGRGCFVQAYVCRQLKDLKGETAAKDLSDVLPFLEYELHRMLLSKLKIQGMNAIFGLQVRITFGAKTLIGIATGTGIFLTALPAPLLPKLVTDSPTDEKKLAEMQKLLCDTVKLNKELYQLKVNEEDDNASNSPDEAMMEDEPTYSNLLAGNRDCCVLEIDDLDDIELGNLLSDPRPPNGFHVVNTEAIPGLDELDLVKNLQMFTQIWRAKLHHPFNLGKHIQTLLQSVYFKLRRMIPCALCHLQFRIDIPESDEIQLNLLGMALELIVPDETKPKSMSVLKDNKKDDDMIFNLEEDLDSNQPGPSYLSIQSIKSRGRSPLRLKTNLKNLQPRERHGIDITPLSYIPGGKIERYLSNLNFFFIRETNSLREEGGLSGFIHSFIMEVLAIIRAHMVALGGNAMVAYYMTECVLSHSLHKNQGQCLINVGGDVVFVSYFAEE